MTHGPAELRRRLVLAGRHRALAGDGRAGSWARAKARRSQRDYLLRRWRRLLTLAIVTVAIGACGLWLIPPALRGFSAGVLVTSVVALLAFWVVQASGTGPTMMGDTAEQWTAAELRRRPRRSGWELVNHLVLKTTDIDHVLVGPGGMYAVETKWSAKPWVLDPLEERVAAAAVQAADNAKSLRWWQPIRSTGVEAVTPVVVLWGPFPPEDGPPAAPLLHPPTGAVILTGHQLRAWREQLPPEGILTREQIKACWNGLDKQAGVRDAREAPCPPSVPAVAGRALGTFGVGVAAFFVLGAAVRLPGGLIAWALAAAAAAAAGIVVHRRAPAAARPYATGWIAGSAASAGLVVVSVFAYYYATR